ncbi:hypothetical protein C5S42_04545 [Candidatus Methanomarinus sp.]|nr:hypothetical protein C5S42_04545 [ANME-2 cluster archaeon]
MKFRHWFWIYWIHLRVFILNILDPMSTRINTIKSQMKCAESRFYRLLLWKLKKQKEMLSETRVIEELEKIRVVLVKRGDKEPQFMFETMGLDQMRLFTALGLETVLKKT